ncbi:hypothetical protein [Bdellovibrio sp. HCB2-146]|uniref:hypothetical protein n=1 Tax=Bdellovibrio sp. HCB2-146 TaxID=3394362 RepID=UPI0039BC565A
MIRSFILCASLSSLLLSCSASEGDFDFAIAPDIAPVIKAKAISCLASKTAAESNTTPTKDIEASYARFQNVSFSYPHSDRALNIFSIEVRIEGLSTPQDKIIITGDDLLALNKVWWDNGEAVIGGPAQRKSYKKPLLKYDPAQIVASDCPLILGSLPGGTPYQGSVTLTAYGYVEDSAGNQEPAQAQTFISINYSGD